jgi:hypothetical protein
VSAGWPTPTVVRRAVCRAGGAAGEAPPRPYTGGAAQHHCAAWPAPVRRAAPPRRGQAVPDPPARRAGRSKADGRGAASAENDGPSVTIDCRAGGAVGRGGASPLQGGTTHPRRRQRHHRDARPPRRVGVRRCLTRRPGRAGHHHASCGWSRSGERCRHRHALPHGAALVRSGRGSAALPPGRVPPPRGPVVARLGSRRPPPGRGRRCRTPERRVALPQRPAAQDTRQGAGCPLALGPRLLERGDEWPDRPLVATLPGQRLDEQRFASGG